MNEKMRFFQVSNIYRKDAFEKRPSILLNHFKLTEPLVCALFLTVTKFQQVYISCVEGKGP